MIATQQPVTQYEPLGHAVVALQTCAPFEHVWPPVGGGAPSGVGAVAQSAGICVLPMQSSQRSHGFVQSATCAHGVHFVGSSMSATLHVDERRTVTCEPSLFCTAQQPKQSHPFGVRPRQNDLHCASCVAGQFLKLAS